VDKLFGHGRLGWVQCRCGAAKPLLISQNRDAKVTEKRANLDWQLNLLSEQENTKMLLMLERIGDAAGAQISKDADVQALAQDVRPEELSDMLDEAAEKEEHGPNRP
jgi:uncharacterized membrane protein